MASVEWKNDILIDDLDATNDQDCLIRIVPTKWKKHLRVRINLQFQRNVPFSWIDLISSNFVFFNNLFESTSSLLLNLIECYRDEQIFGGLNSLSKFKKKKRKIIGAHQTHSMLFSHLLRIRWVHLWETSTFSVNCYFLMSYTP